MSLLEDNTEEGDFMLYWLLQTANLEKHLNKRRQLRIEIHLQVNIEQFR